ncbi:MAG: CBS domain-containing protein, partial [Bacteroidetes bacterium]|nr:CBS domain-containing protein [Bacteroidota bacterium]
LMPVIIVPGTMLAKDVLNALTKRRKSIAVVVDEYGGTSGIITVEDIIEELFGEIEDEHDTTELTEDVLSEGHYRFSARLEVDYINETYNIDIEENEHYETLGGYIVYFTEEIPEQGEKVVIDNFTFTILEVSNTKIELVEMTVHTED